jgi:hypothetical protein
MFSIELSTRGCGCCSVVASRGEAAALLAVSGRHHQTARYRAAAPDTGRAGHRLITAGTSPLIAGTVAFGRGSRTRVVARVFTGATTRCR